MHEITLDPRYGDQEKPLLAMVSKALDTGIFYCCHIPVSPLFGSPEGSEYLVDV